MTEPFTLALVGCGKTKLAHPAPARDLYTGQLFRAATEYVEQRFDRWAILSAKHGVVHPNRLLSPYDVAMADLDAQARQSWGANVGAMARLGCGAFPRAVRAHFGCKPMRNNETFTTPDEAPPIRLVIFAGRPYVESLPKEWHDRFDIETPLAGLGIGQRLGWFAQQRREAAA